MATPSVIARAEQNWSTIAARMTDAPQAFDESFIATAISHRAVAGGTAGLWRIARPDATAPVSVVVKRIKPPSSGSGRWHATSEPSDPFYWAREALAYESDFFGDERSGLRSARCYHVDRHEDIGTVVEQSLQLLEDIA